MKDAVTEPTDQSTKQVFCLNCFKYCTHDNNLKNTIVHCACLINGIRGCDFETCLYKKSRNLNEKHDFIPKLTVQPKRKSH